MEVETSEVKSRRDGPGWFRAALLLIGVAVMLGLLPYSWGRVLIASLLDGAPEPRYAGLLVLGIVVIWGLAFFVKRGLSTSWKWTVSATIAVLWIATNSVVAWTCAGPFFPRAIVVPGYGLASLWVMWLAWLPLPPLRWRFKFGCLLLLLAGCVGFFLVFEVEGLMGGNQVNFGWRKWGKSAISSPTLISKSDAELPEQQPGSDYPQFLGPTRTACLANIRLNLDWSSNPPRELWRRSVGAGWGSFAIVGDYAVTQEQRQDDECVVCYRLQTGEELWVHRDQARYYDGYGGAGPRATPTIDSDQVFAVGATGILSCLDLSTGSVNWSKNILADNRASNQEYGVCCSPLVSGDLVIVCPTGKQGPTLVAYERDTGQRIWQAGRDQASYSSPVLVEIEGVRQVVIYSSSRVAAFDLDGKSLWEFAWSNSEGINAAQPIIDAGDGNRVVVSTGYGVGSAMLRVFRLADGGFSVQSQWTNPRFQAKFTTPVYRNGLIYALDEGILACMEIEMGRRLWKEGRYGHGQILLVDNALLVQAEAGELILVLLTDDGPVEAGSVEALHAKTWNHPALAGSFLLLRNDREAVCYRLTLNDRDS